MKLKTVTITKRDFDKAASRPWSQNTCVLAQTATRYGIDHNLTIALASDAAMRLRNDFDNLFQQSPNLKSKKVLELRNRLPLKVTLP